VSLKSCLAKFKKDAISEEDRRALQANVRKGMTETEAVDAAIEAARAELNGVLDKIEAAGGTIRKVAEDRRPPKHAEWDGPPRSRERVARRSPGRTDGEQGELFTAEDARPGTNAKQLALSNELLREWADRAARGTKKIKTLVAAFDTSFRTDHAASLLGYNLNDAKEFALLAQVFRDPRYETLRYFFTDKNGVVIAETGVSARLPGGAQAWPAGASEQWLVDTFKRTKADGIRLLHNHPSGRSNWSQADLNITRKIAAVLRVPVEHVIIDSNEYSVLKVASDGVLEDGSEASIPLKELGPDKMLKPKGRRNLKPFLGRELFGPRDVAKLAQELKRGSSRAYVTVLGLSARHDVRAIGDIKVAGIKSFDELSLALHDFGLQHGSPAIVVVGVDPEAAVSDRAVYGKLIKDGYLLDVVDAAGHSLAERFGYASGGKTLGRIELLDTEEVGSAKPFGEARAREPLEDRRRPAPERVENKAQRELALEAAQRDLDELINPHTTETSAFKRWFGKSKVVDSKGKPLVVYHGTAARTDFAAFEESADVGFHFGTAKAAADRLGLYPDTKRGTQIKHARVIPVYLSIKNPLRMDDLSDWEGGEVIKELQRLEIITGDEAVALHRKMRDVAEGDIPHLDVELFRELLEAKGYDGVVYKNETEGIELRPFDFTIDDVEVRGPNHKLSTPWEAFRPDGTRLTGSSSEEGLQERLKDLFEHGDTVETDSWIALRSTQIKSAIGNKGTFSNEQDAIDLASGPPSKSGMSGGPGARYVEMYRYKGAPGAPTRSKLREGELEIPAEPIRAQHVMELFQRLFKVKIYEGKPFKIRNALGFFRPKNYEVRNKYRNDLEVAAHEVFHWLDRTYPSIRKLYHMRRYADELKGVSYDETKLHEGFAEFGRLFMTQEPEAIERLPTFYEAFVKEARDAGILDKLEQVQKLMHQWYLQGAESRARSKIGKGGMPVMQRLQKMADGFIDRALASSLDARQAAKVIERETRGKEAFADAAMSPYKSIRLLGGVRSTINTWLNYGTLKWTPEGDLERNGVGLKQIFEPIADVFDEAMGYFVALRADELRVHSKENLLSKDETTALIERAKKTGKLEQIQRAHSQYQQYVKRLLSFAVQSGILDPKTKAVWEEMYQNYVPFYRVAEKFGSLDPRMAGGTQGGLFRKLTGGTANINDVFENITLNTALVVHASMKNVAMRQLFAAIESSPVGQRYAVRIGDDTELRKVGIAQVQRVLNEFAKAAADKYHETDEADQATRIEYGQMAMLARKLARRDPDQGQLTMGDVMQQAKFFFTGRPPQIPDKQMVLVRGEPVWFQIGDPMLWDMLTDMNYHEPIGLTERILGIAKRTLTRGVTASPEFQFANILRDTFNAFTMSKGGQLPIIDALKAIKDIWTESPAYVDFLANGGGFGNATGDEAKKLRVQMGATGRRRLLAAPAEVLDFWDKWGQSFELATRLAEYKRVRAKGATRREAAFQGREISTDFSMRGHSALARFASISIPFFNARLQGLYRIEREINEKRGRQSPFRGERALTYATRALSGLTLPSLLIYWFLNRGDDDYEELGEEIKSLNTVVPGPDGTMILIPRPFETGALFQEVPIRLLRYYEKRDGEELVDAMMFMIANTFNFNPTPQLVQPPLRVMLNQQWNGLPVVPRSLENVEPREQFQPATADTYKRVGEAFNVSPLKLRALWEGYTGTIGAYAVAASDALLQAPDTSGAEPSRSLSQYPLFRRFMREQPYVNTSFENRFYELMDEVTVVVDTARKMRREARADDLDDYLGDAERAALFAISGPTTANRELAADLNAQMRALRSDPALSAEEKAEQIAELQAEQNALFRQSVEAFDAALLEEARRALEQGR
jgi:DNA repair protein RadC